MPVTHVGAIRSLLDDPARCRDRWRSEVWREHNTRSVTKDQGVTVSVDVDSTTRDVMLPSPSPHLAIPDEFCLTSQSCESGQLIQKCSYCEKITVAPPKRERFTSLLERWPAFQTRVKELSCACHYSLPRLAAARRATPQLHTRCHRFFVCIWTTGPQVLDSVATRPGTHQLHNGTAAVFCLGEHRGRPRELTRVPGCVCAAVAPSQCNPCFWARTNCGHQQGSTMDTTTHARHSQ